MIISVKWNDKNSTFKIGEYTFNVEIIRLNEAVPLELTGRHMGGHRDKRP